MANAPPQRTSGSVSIPAVMVSRQVAAGTQLGEYIVGQPLWPLRAADAYRATGPKGSATLYIVHATIAQTPGLRDALIAGTRAAAQLPEHKHIVRTLAAGLTGDVLWIATEDVDGSLVRDMLIKKRTANQAGLGARATGNLVGGVCAALAEVSHGALASESVVVNRAGRVRVVDLALASGTIAAIRAGLLPHPGSVAPEVVAGEPPSGASDVYGVGALLYEALVGKPLERGGPRPSEMVPGMSAQIDEVVARSCHRDPAKRFGRVDVLGEVVAEALGKGGALQTQAVPKLEEAPTLEKQVSLAAEIAGPASSGSQVVDRALASALADTTEKWLITKGRLDYGPFSLADVVAQIERGQIVGDNSIMDKDTGARSSVGRHPLLGPMADAARQRIDDARRAQAEVQQQKNEKKKGVTLYALIGGLVIAVGTAGYLVYNAVEGDHGQAKTSGVSTIDTGSLKVSVSEPKPPPKKPRPSGGGAGGHRPSGGGGGGGGGGQVNGSENMSLDLSDDSDDASETLPMGEVYATYSHYGGQLGGCLQSNGGGSANISIIIDGKSGRVTWVKVNGQQGGGLWGCLNGVMRSLQFRRINGPRTRAEFDIGI